MSKRRGESAVRGRTAQISWPSESPRCASKGQSITLEPGESQSSKVSGSIYGEAKAKWGGTNV